MPHVTSYESVPEMRARSSAEMLGPTCSRSQPSRVALSPSSTPETFVTSINVRSIEMRPTTGAYVPRTITFAIRQGAHVAVVITDRQRRDQALARRFKRAAIADRLAGQNPFQHADPRVQRHHRPRVWDLKRHRQHIAPKTVQHAAGAHDVSPRFAMAVDARRV